MDAYSRKYLLLEGDTDDIIDNNHFIFSTKHDYRLK